MNKPHKNSLLNSALNYLSETTIDLLNLSYKIVLDPEELIKTAGFKKNLYLPSSFFKKTYTLKYSSYFKNINKKLYLTEKGRIEIIKRFIKNQEKIKKWDGQWRAIIFDIPEITKRERNFLRKELKWLGFKELQHSVWVTPYDIKKELLTLLKLWHKDFNGDIKFLEINQITEDTDIRKMFHL